MNTPSNPYKPRLNALIVDHHDSFTQNLRSWLEQKFNVCIISADELSQKKVSSDLVVLSAGPKSPQDYSHSLNWLKENPHQPTLGICLGMQMMTMVEGGTVTPYMPVQHGKTSCLVFFNPDFPNIQVARYHSLECHVTPKFLTHALSQNDDIAMWVEHKTKPWLGWQFHPESFLTADHGFLISYLETWLESKQ